MRIIDKNKDFYDYLQGIYPDRLLVFDRTGSFVLTKQALCGCIPKRVRRPGCFVLLQVCNTFWLYYARLVQKSDVSVLEQPEYNFELVASWKNYNKQRQLLKLDLIDFSAGDIFPNSWMFWRYEDNNKMAAALASVDFSEKKDLLMAAVDADNWCIHPIPLLTAVGNGKGGGDYFGVNNELVGRWAGDALYIDDEEPVEPFKEIFPIFREKWQNFTT